MKHQRRPSCFSCALFVCVTLFFMRAHESYARESDTSSASNTSATPVFWAHDFVDSVGVNVHLLHPDSFYGAHFPLLKERLLSAHITHVRDGAMDQRGALATRSDLDQADRFKELGKAGIRGTFIVRLSASEEFVRGFPAHVSPAFEAYELPNELNGQRKVPWVEALQTWMPKFKQYASARREGLSYPVIGPSLIDFGSDPYGQLGNQQQYVDFGNFHKYYRTFNPGTLGYGRPGQPPCDAFRFGSLDYALCHVKKISGDKPIICTEAGYGSNPQAKNQVTPEVQAKFIVRMLMLHFQAGVKRTFVYQLADYGNDGFGNFGLLTAEGEEKPAFRELRGVMNELYDNASTGTPKQLSMTLVGDVTDVHSVLLQKADGSYRLVLWLEKPGYDPKDRNNPPVPLKVPPQNVRVTLPTSHYVRRVLTFEDSGAMKTQSRSRTSQPQEFAVPDNLMIIDIAG